MVYLKLLLTAGFWGGTFIAGKFIADNVGPFSAAFLRFVIASVLLLVIAYKTHGRLPAVQRRHILPVVLLGLSGIFAYNVFFFKALAIIEAGRAALIIATCPVFITCCSMLLFGERFSFAKAAGVFLSVAGAVVVICKGNFRDILGSGVGLGEFYILGCVAMWVMYSLVGKKVMEELSPVVCVGYSAVVGTAALFVPACVEGMISDIAIYSMRDWLSIVYLGVFGTVVGFVWYYQGIRAIGLTRAGLFINFVPVFAIVLSFFILSESVTESLLIGTVLVCIGIYLTNKKSEMKV